MNMQRKCKTPMLKQQTQHNPKRSDEHAHAHHAHDAVENKTSYLQPSLTPTATMNTRLKKPLEPCI